MLDHVRAKFNSTHLARCGSVTVTQKAAPALQLILKMNSLKLAKWTALGGPYIVLAAREDILNSNHYNEMRCLTRLLGPFDTQRVFREASNLMGAPQ